jgi:transposase
MAVYGGLDWASKEHAVCVVDGDGTVAFQRMTPHTDNGLTDLVKRLGRIAPAEEIRIAIERPDGVLVDTLVAAGFRVVPIHPNVLKACRSRYATAGGKSDPGDAYMLADVLRTDGHRFEDLEPSSDKLKALRSLVRTRDDLVQARVATSNRLQALLESFWPGPVGLFSDLDTKIAMAFIERYPTPRAAKRLGLKRMRSFLAGHAYPVRKAEQLLEHLRSAPRGQTGPEEEAAKGELCQTLVRLLRSHVEEIRKVTSAIEVIVEELPMGEIILSFPGNGKVNAAKLAAEIGDIARFPTEESLAAESGVAPVTYQSGKHRGVGRRRACNTRLLVAVTCFANSSRKTSPWAAHVYAKARARGCDHPHAVRVLGRAWIRVFWKALSDRKPYDVTKHRAAQDRVAWATPTSR